MVSAMLEVPHFRQLNDNADLVACAQMVLAYYGRPSEIDRLITLFDGVSDNTMVAQVMQLKKWGYGVSAGPTDIEQIQSWLRHSIPPIVALGNGAMSEKESPQMVVLVGLDQQNAYLNDPRLKDHPHSMSLSDFTMAWNAAGQMGAAVMQMTY
ncbi:MAG: cysteine peptidase family C39 domain-containing protein [Chloroflexota bacterium]